jgi:hypothetical protein
MLGVWGMPRKNRIWYPGAVYHIMCRGNHRHDIFRDEEDRLFYISTLKKNQLKLRYSIMTNSKILFNGIILSVQPRIRLIRSFDELSYVGKGFTLGKK